MIITDIQIVNKKKCRIYIDGKKAFVLYRGELFKYNMKVGNEIDENTFNIIMYDVLRKRARLRALHILEKQDKTKKQLLDKLYQGGFPEELIDDAINYVESYHYIDDERYARQYIRCKIAKKSKKQLINNLLQRGIDKETAILAYDDISAELINDSMGDCNLETEDVRISNKYMFDIEGEQIKKIISKRLPNTNVTIKDKQRVYRYLISKGFSSSDICSHLSLY